MNKPFLKTAMSYSVLAGVFILLDLAIDHLIGGVTSLNTSHLIFTVSLVLISFILLSRAIETHRHAETVLRQARDEMEIRVRERTAELELTNNQLHQEVAERKQAEQAQRNSEETTRALMNASSESALLLDTQGIVLAANEIAAQRLNTTVEQMVGSSLFNFFSLDVANRRRSYLAQVLHVRQPTYFEDERDGRTFDIYIHPVSDADGKIIRLAVFGQDITERKKVEMELRESEERYRTQFDNFSEPTTVWDKNGVLLMQNLVSSKNLGGKREDYLGKTIFKIFGDAAKGYMERMARVITTGITEEQEDVVELYFGKRYFWTSMQRIQYTDGRYAVQIISYDITDRKLAEEALRASEEKFSTVFHFSPDAIGIVRVADGTFVDVNETFTRMLGYSRSDVIGKSWMELGFISGKDEQNKVTELLRDKQQVFDYELDVTTRENNVATMLISLISITVNGEPCVLAIAHDVTERKRSEKALQQAQAELTLGIQGRIAMEERQRLARELHDSVSQTLYGISLGTHTALTLFDTERTKVLEALNYVLSLAQAGLTEMRALIFELRPESLEMEGLVTALTKQTAALQARYDIEVELSLCDEPEIPLSIKEVLYRIAQEALHNAVKHAQPNRLDVRLICEPERLYLEVCDNGVGFDPQVFYPGHLGLRSMRERATRVGGTIDIISAPDCGTQIRVYVPIPKVH
jgi:PAS domain S-box-containing protein